MPIHVFVPYFRVDEVLAEIKICLEKGWTGLGFKTLEFEERWKEYTGLPHAHFLTSNTVGLHLAVHIFKKVYGWADGDEIITTPFTFVSTNHAILYERLKPVFADIDETLCLDPATVESKITSQTRAVMFVGFGGNAGQFQKMAALCKKHGLKLILDAAHMSGTRLNGKHAGHGADAAVFSYQAVKNLPTGDSGMICFADSELDKLARKLSWMGIDKDTYERSNQAGYQWHYNVEDVGFKYHGNSIQAAMALVSLKYLDEDNRRRNELAALYDSLLSDESRIHRIPLASNCQTSRHLYQVRVERRDEIMQHFYDHDIFPGVHYIDSTEYPMYAYGKGTCSNAFRASCEIISLPMHLRLKDDDVVRVAEVLKEAVRR